MFDQIILAPIITEKSTQGQEKDKYEFFVNRRANKIEVKKSIKELYGVDVIHVRIINGTSKKKLTGKGLIEKRAELKKAIVRVKKGQKIDIHKLKSSKK